MEARKVIGIVAGPDKKDDLPQILVKAVLAGAREEGTKTEIRDLRSPETDHPEGCNTGSTPAEILPSGDLAELLDRITNADGIVLGSSASGDEIPAELERTLDQITDALHGRRLAGKFGCCVCASKGADSPKILNYMKVCLERFGITVIGGMCTISGDEPADPEKNRSDARDLGRVLARFIVKDLADPGDEESPQDREEFCRMMKSERDSLNGELNSFIQNEWTNGP
jgi:multimeric flavodoxin WrbA